MSIENTSTIAGLVATNPTQQDPVYQGPNHFWTIKSVLKNIFPGAGGQGFSKPITATEDELNRVAGVTAPLQAQINALQAQIDALESSGGGGGGGGGGFFTDGTTQPWGGKSFLNGGWCFCERLVLYLPTL